MINHFPHMATVCRRPCLWYEPSVRLHTKLQFALAYALHTLRLPPPSEAAASSGLVATKQTAIVVGAKALLSAPKADEAALAMAFTGLSRAWIVERPDKLQRHVSDACANADPGWHALQLSDWLTEYAVRALAVPLLEMVRARVGRGGRHNAMLVVAAPVQDALALLRAGEVLCHSRQQWKAAQALLYHGWTPDELIRQAELCVSEAMSHGLSLPPATELEARGRDLAATVQELQACSIGPPMWCVQMHSQNASGHASKTNTIEIDKGSHNGALMVTFKSLTGLLSILQTSAAVPRVVLKRFPPSESLLHGERGLVVVRQWVLVLSLQPLVVVGHKDILPYTCRPHQHGHGVRLNVSSHTHGMMPQVRLNVI